MRFMRENLSVLVREYEPVRGKGLLGQTRCEAISGSSRRSVLLVQRQTEPENGAMPRLTPGADPAQMVFDNLFTNGKAEACALRLSVGGEGLEQARRDLQRNPSSRILDFRDHILACLFEANFDRA